MRFDQEPELPGMSLQQWLELMEMSYAAFARLIPCSIGYPRMIAQGLARPSYEMACRIENVTGGAVPRTRWYAPGENIAIQKEEDIDI